MNAEPSKHKNIDMEKSVVERQPEVNILAFFIVVASSQIFPHNYLFSPAKLLLIHRFSKKIIITYCVVGKNRYLCVLLRVALFY